MAIVSKMQPAQVLTQSSIFERRQFAMQNCMSEKSLTMKKMYKYNFKRRKHQQRTRESKRFALGSNMHSAIQEKAN